MSKNKNATKTKDRLKTMEQGSHLHIFRTAKRIAKYGIIGFGRNIWLSITATLVMTLTLTLLFMTIAASTVLNTTANAMREKIDISIYFQVDNESAQKTLTSMADTMRKDSNVKSVSFTTGAEECQATIEDLTKENTNTTLVLDDEETRKALCDGMPSVMRVKVYEASDLSSIKNIVNTDKEFVEFLDTKRPPSYETKSTAIDTIASWSNIAKNGGLILCGIFLIVSILVIFNTIRMAIYSRSEEIYMEKLVGADNGFIRGPFLVEAMICGIIAGVLASGVGIGIIHLIAPKLQSYDIDISEVMGIINSVQILAIFGGLILCGALIALISSRFAVRKYLRKI